MDSFSINIKLEKANAIKKHRQLQKIASLFRFVEICLVLALVSRFSVGLPVAVKNSSEYFKDLTVILVSPRFVFVIGNVIVITLFAKSGQLSAGRKSTTDIYEEFVKKSERSQGMYHYEAEYKDKQNNCIPHMVKNREKPRNPVQSIVKKEQTFASLESKNYRRSQSEKLERANGNKSCIELKRCATEKLRGSVDSSEGWVKISYPEDRMSNEEFKCTIEAFIERQKKFRRNEENYCME